MSWSVDDIYKYLLFLTRSNQSGRISATDFFYSWNAEQNQYHSDLLGKWQAQNNGKEGANTGMILNETTIGLLSPFTIPASITIISGKATFPDDFIYKVASRVEVNGIEYLLNEIHPSQKTFVNQDVIDPPSIADKKYYAIRYEDYYEFLPIDSAGKLNLDYVASPTDVKWNYSFDVDGRQVYNPSGSVQPKWNQSTVVEITNRTLTKFGVSLKDRDFSQFGHTNTITGDS